MRPVKINAVVERQEILAALRAQSAARPDARVQAIEILTEEFVRQLVRRSPKDTNRYVRGWVGAAADLGLSPVPMPPLLKSQYRNNLLARLERQVEFWNDRRAYWQLRKDQQIRADQKRGTIRRGKRKGQLTAARTSQPYYLRTVLPKLRQAENNLRKAVEQLERFEADETGSSLVIFRQTTRRSRTIRATIRDKVYGGRGRWVVAGDETFAELTNLEPHVRIVEKMHGSPMRASLAVVRAFGVRRASDKYLQEMQRRSDLRLSVDN